DKRRGAGTELTRAIGRRQGELEAVRDLLQAVVNRDPGHAESLSVAFLADDVGQRSPGLIEVVVNYSVLELVPMLELLAGVRQATPDHGLGVLRPGAEPALELLHRGRQDEDADATRIERAHLPRPLPVDLEHEVLAAGERFLDDTPRSSVAVAVYLRAFEELAPLAHGKEGRLVDKVVLAPLRCPRARRARGVRHGQLAGRIVPEDRPDEGAFAGARRGRADEEPSAASGGRHSMFWACSRICSTRSLSSMARSAICPVA